MKPINRKPLLLGLQYFARTLLLITLSGGSCDNEAPVILDDCSLEINGPETSVNTGTQVPIGRAIGSGWANTSPI